MWKRSRSVRCCHCVPNCQWMNKVALANFKGLSQDEVRPKFAENILSLWKKNKTKKPYERDNFNPNLSLWTVPLSEMQAFLVWGQEKIIDSEIARQILNTCRCGETPGTWRWNTWWREDGVGWKTRGKRTPAWVHRGIKSSFCSHETSQIICIDKPAPAIQC
jgi:hypothetical protein